MQSVRLVEFDLLRIISAVAVIIIHVTSMDVPLDAGVIGVNQVSRFAVPFFFILSGYLMCHVSRKIKVGAYYTHRLPKLVIPYILWTLIYDLYWVCLGELAIADLPLTFLRDVSLGTCFVHFYFFFALMQLYIMFPLLMKWLEKNAQSLVSVSLVITVASHTLIFLHLAGIITLPETYVGYARFFPLWIFFFVAGMLVALRKEEFTSEIKSTRIGLFGTAYALVLTLLISDWIYSGVYDTSIKPIVILYSVMAFIFLYALAVNCRRFLLIHRQRLSYFSQHSLFVLLLHPMIVNLLQLYFPTPQILNMHPDVYLFLMFFIVTASSFLISALVGKWFYAPLFGGVYFKKIKSIVRRG